MAPRQPSSKPSDQSVPRGTVIDLTGLEQNSVPTGNVKVGQTADHSINQLSWCFTNVDLSRRNQPRRLSLSQGRYARTSGRSSGIIGKPVFPLRRENSYSNRSETVPPVQRLSSFVQNTYPQLSENADGSRQEFTNLDSSQTNTSQRTAIKYQRPFSPKARSIQGPTTKSTTPRRTQSVLHGKVTKSKHQISPSTTSKKAVSRDANYHSRQQVQQQRLNAQTISDEDEDEGAVSTRYQMVVEQLKSTKARIGHGFGQVDSFIELISDDEGEDIDDSALFSELPLFLQQDDDIEVIKTITRNTSVPNAEFQEIREAKYKNCKCSADKCVEFNDGTFMRIKKVVEDQAKHQWVIGQLFVRHNELKDAKWPRRHNEVVHTVKVKKGQSIEIVRKPLDQVRRNRHLILTNQSFPSVSTRTHPDSWNSIELDKELGPLFCRWKQTLVIDGAGKVVEESIEQLSFDESDVNTRLHHAAVRLKWRGVPTVPGGDHRYFMAQVTENAHSFEESQKYVFGDCFCGGGGASCGADQAGLFVKFGVDLNKKAIDTYKLNFERKGTECLLQDIHHFIAESVPINYMVDVLHISPPCQPFSPAHTVANEVRDEQNQAAMFAVGELITGLRPRIVTLEETYGLFNRHKVWFNALIKMFVDRGYSVRWTGAKLEEWGLPQKRRRLLIIAAGPGEALPLFPNITHSEVDQTLRPLTTIHDVISGIPSGIDVKHHNLRGAIYDISQYKPPYSIYSQAKTITTSGGIGNHHPSGTRAFTIRELAALQKFPTTYKFADTNITDLRRQIGNAVPPLIFKKIYREIIKSLKKTDELL